MVFSLKGLGFGFSLFWSSGSSVAACYRAAIWLYGGVVLLAMTWTQR